MKKRKALWLSFSSSSSSPQLFQNIEGFGAKKYFAGHQTTDAVQLIITIKTNFSGLFSEQVAAKRNFPENTWKI